MAVYPEARWLPIPENWTQPRITPTQVILHSAVDADGPTSLYAFFGRADVVVESHFFIKLDGEVEEYLDTTVRADANLDANVRAVSIETEDDGEPDQRPWTDAQLASIKRLLSWLFATHSGIARRVCPAWDQSGVGYHVMWGAPSHWTPIVKTCPGTVRIAQFNSVIRPWLDLPIGQPERSEEDDEDMPYLHASKFTGVTYVDGSGGTWVSDPATVNELVAQGVKVIRTDANQSDATRIVGDRAANTDEAALASEKAQEAYLAAIKNLLIPEVVA